VTTERLGVDGDSVIGEDVVISVKARPREIPPGTDIPAAQNAM
jgi:hypothetical protein